MATYKISIFGNVGRQEFECPDDVYILDAAEEAGIKLPYSCRAGSCSSCAAEILSGNIDQTDQFFLDDDQQRQFALLCVSYPKSDCSLIAKAEERINNGSWGNNRMLKHYFYGNGRPMTLTEMGLSSDVYNLIFQDGAFGLDGSIHCQ